MSFSSFIFFFQALHYSVSSTSKKIAWSYAFFGNPCFVVLRFVFFCFNFSSLLLVLFTIELYWFYVLIVWIFLKLCSFFPWCFWLGFLSFTSAAPFILRFLMAAPSQNLFRTLRLKRVHFLNHFQLMLHFKLRLASIIFSKSCSLCETLVKWIFFTIINAK